VLKQSGKFYQARSLFKVSLRVQLKLLSRTQGEKEGGLKESTAVPARVIIIPTIPAGSYLIEIEGHFISAYVPTYLGSKGKVS
jgi:hypothetical protein